MSRHRAVVCQCDEETGVEQEACDQAAPRCSSTHSEAPGTSAQALRPFATIAEKASARGFLDTHPFFNRAKA